jgi:hypothetical protein
MGYGYFRLKLTYNVVSICPNTSISFEQKKAPQFLEGLLIFSNSNKSKLEIEYQNLI